MHYDLQLRKNGRLFRMEWFAKDGVHVERELGTDEVERSLCDTVCVAPETRIGDLLRLISDHAEVFEFATGCSHMSAFLEEARADAPEGAGDDLVAAELEWTAVLDDEEGQPVLLQKTHFYGQAKDGSACALEFTPVNHLYEVPLLINDTLNICDGGDPYKVLLSAVCPMTLLDLVSGVMSELAFFSSPQERNRSLDEIKERCRQMADGECETHTLEELQDQMRVRAESDRKRFPCRSCGRDARCACFGKPQDLCHGCFIEMKEN